MENLKERYFSSFLIFTLLFVGISSVLVGGNMAIYSQMLCLAFIQNISFTFVSRARQRDNFNYHLIAAVFSNGVWFVTFGMAINNMHLGLLFPLLSGSALGSLFAAYISRDKIEKKLKLTADATKKIKRDLTILDWIPSFILLFICFLYFVFFLPAEETILSMFLFMFCVYCNNLTTALASRAKNRESHNYLIITIIISVAVWVGVISYIVQRGMPWSLFVPYTVATVFGSLTGAKVSEKIEIFFGFQPNRKSIGRLEIESFKQFVEKWWLLAIFLIFSFSAAVYFPMGKTFSFLMFGVLIFFADEMTHAIASRASNRNKTYYHGLARVVKGVVWFLTLSYMAENRMSPDSIMPMFIGIVLGGFFGQKLGSKIESKIGAVMDDSRK